MINSKNQPDLHAGQTERHPVFLNPKSGSFEHVFSALDNDRRIKLHCLPPKQMTAAIGQAVRQGCPRVIVSGGDGTLALAASRLAESKTELGILPGGTLNHFAGRLGIPDDTQAALELALTGQARSVSAGYVNEQLFLNTCSVGAYVFFVRTREHLENHMNYYIASLLAGIRRLVRFRSAKINLNGQVMKSPLVFIGVNERELRFPILGQEQNNGGQGLHVIAVKSHGRVETFKIACKAIFRGIDPLEQANDIENLIIEGLELGYHRKTTIEVALDGELLSLSAPLKFRFDSSALFVVVPETAKSP
jgi:diacylglycerol kinase family enzyme